MPFDSDIAVLGTGIAPLVAANLFLSQGKSVLLLNPDRDFFLEDSELPLDPFLPHIPHPSRLTRSLPTYSLETLRPDFPGPVEFWHPGIKHFGYHDLHAPHVRQRNRLWVASDHPEQGEKRWEELEKLYVEAADAGLNPQIIEGPGATHRLPGMQSFSRELSALLIPKLCDVDVVRYRNGLLELVRERLGSQKFVVNATQIDWMPEGIRFTSQGSPVTARLKEGMLVFWTPRLSSWILNQAKKEQISPKLPRGVRLWEQWTLELDRPLDFNTVGMYEDMIIWTEVEGAPEQSQLPRPSYSDRRNKDQVLYSRLVVLRAGPLVPLDTMVSPETGLNWASTESFAALSKLCHQLLKRERFSIQALKTKAIFEWGSEESWLLSNEEPPIRVIPSCDGPLVEIMRVVRSECERLLMET